MDIGFGGKAVPISRQHGIDEALVHLFVDDEMRQAPRGSDNDAFIPGIGFYPAGNGPAKLEAALR